MGLTSNTGLLASVQEKYILPRDTNNQQTELRCDVTPAPFILRPYAGLYNPFSHACSVLCNHPADNAAREFVKKAKDAWFLEGKAGHILHEDISKFQDQCEKEKNRTPHDIVTEDMFRRYTETDSRPLTPAPTLASGKSRGSRRCLTPDQPRQRTTIVLDLRRSHSQETLYYHGYGTSELTVVQSPSVNDRSTLPSLNLSGSPHKRLANGAEQLPPLASPLVLAKRTPKELVSVRTVKKNQLKALNLGKMLKNKKNGAPASQRSKDDKDANDADGTMDEQNMDDGVVEGGEMRRRGKRRRKGRTGGSDRLTSAGLAAQAQQDPETQIAGIVTDSQNPSSRGSIAQASEDDIILPVAKPSAPARKTDSFLDDDILKYLHREVDEDAIETEFDTKRRYVLEEAFRTRPERSYGQEMQALLREYRIPAVSLGDWLHIPRAFSRQNAQFSLPLNSNAKALESQFHFCRRRYVLEEAFRTRPERSYGQEMQALLREYRIPAVSLGDWLHILRAFSRQNAQFSLPLNSNAKALESQFHFCRRRYVLEEAFRTRPERSYGQEMQALLREYRVPAVSLGDWLHIPRAFSRQNAQFSLPLDSNALETLTPMNYAARFVTVKKSKQLLYLTVLRKFRPRGYRMPIKDIQEGLTLMMGGILSSEQAEQFQVIMEWEHYEEDENIPDEIKLTLLDTGFRKPVIMEGGDTGEPQTQTIKYRTWCGLCAICERMYGRFPPREKDPPDGMELSDFTMIETRLAILKVHGGLIEVLNTIRTR